MQQRRVESGRFDNVITTVVLASSSLLTAVVCFGFLRSQANFDFRGSFTGAIAGFIASFLVLGQLLRQLQASSTELEKFHALNSRQLQDLQDKNQELQQKLIRGAPHPEDFDIEVDERQRLVLARPAKWQPGGGVLFQFQSPPDQLHENDPFPARIVVSYEPITADTQDRDHYYERMMEEFERGMGRLSGPYRPEFIHIGGEPHGLRSLRVVTQSYVRIRKRLDPVKGTQSLQHEYVSYQDFHWFLYNSVVDFINDRIHAGTPTALLKNEQLAKMLLLEVENHLERGQLRDMDAAYAFLEETLKAQQPQPIGPAVDASEESLTTEARQGVYQVSGPIDLREAKQEEHIQILPVGRAIVICYHLVLNKIFYFEFASNPAEYSELSGTFDQMIKSVRFLT